ncbi:hypothetical protein HDU96_007508, partial [Phlyctochytrium bullatum]
SVGCLVLEMLTGSHPWKNVSGNLLYLLGTGKTPPIPDNISPLSRAFLDMCFIVDPEKRPTATELLAHEFVTGASTTFNFQEWAKEAEERRKNKTLSVVSSAFTSDSDDDDDDDDSDDDDDDDDESEEEDDDDNVVEDEEDDITDTARPRESAYEDSSVKVSEDDRSMHEDEREVDLQRYYNPHSDEDDDQSSTYIPGSRPDYPVIPESESRKYYSDD